MYTPVDERVTMETIALVGCSYYYNYIRIGVLVLYLHDVSDIFADLLKLFNYCELEVRPY